MKYFYCQSYQAFNMAMAMNMEEKVVIITAAENIMKACKFLRVDYIKHKRFSRIEMIKEKQAVKDELNRLIHLINDNELHFSHTQFAVFCFLLVNELIKKGKSPVFHNFEFLYNKPKVRIKDLLNYLKTTLIKNLIKYLYKVSIELRMSVKGAYIISLKLNFITSKCKTINNKDEYYQITLNLFKKKDLDIPDIKYLFIAQNLSDRFYNTERVNEVLKILNTEKVYLKNHPKLENIKGMERAKKLPDYIPVEFFFNKVRKAVISFHSASLITASQFNTFETLSFLNYIKKDDGFLNDIEQDMMVKSDNRIIFEKDLNRILAYND